MTVLDASAVFALVHDEPGADVVAEALRGARLSTVNLAEVVGKLADHDVEVRRVRPLLQSAGVTFEPFTPDDAELCGALRPVPEARRLSLGDRACLALGLRSTPPLVLTADRAWSKLDLPLEVRLLR